MEKEPRTIWTVPYPGRANIRCQDCNISQICIPYTLNANELNRLDKIIERKTPFQKGHLLFKAGDQFTTLYAIRSGTIKSYVTQQGETQINAFYSTGDLIGLDAIDSLQHPSSAQVLDTSMVCEIPFESLDDLSNQIPTLRRQLLRLMSNQIKQEQARIFSLSKKNAKERLALFIYMFTQKMAQLGLSSTVFRLSMSRVDISNYLGLTVETISRLFSAFEQNGILAARGKYITIHNNKLLLQMIKQ